MQGCIAEIAARLNERLPELASDIHHFVEDAIPQLSGDPLTLELLSGSAKGNVDTLLRALRYHIPVEKVEAPSAALEHARRLAQHGVPLNALVRSYRLGQRRMNELVFDAVRSTEMPPEARIAVLEEIGATLFGYIDWISQQVVTVYEEERERWLETQNSVRAVRVRELLAGKKAIDVDAVTTSIRYPLQWHHLAVVMWYPDAGADLDELPRLQRFLGQLSQAAGAAANPLFVAENRVAGWGWLPFKAPRGDAVTKARAFAAGCRDAPRIGIGTTAAGVDGFRRSHHQAQKARAVAIARPQGPTVLAATDPGLSVAALLSADVGETREWVAEVLGDLVGDNENDSRLRETLRVFLRCGSSYKLAAEQLTLHSNTVKYRVGRAVARRGRAIDDDRLDVELALLVCQWYGAAVLQHSG